jgi:hypothetical protein
VTRRLALVALCAAGVGCAFSPPDPRACIAGLTDERVVHLMGWAGEQMGVSGAVEPPVIRCAPASAMAEMYHWAGATDAEKPLGFYAHWTATVYLHDARSYPDGNEHVLVHELAHHLQWTHELPMTKAERETQAEAVHEKWMDQRRLSCGF